MQKPKKNDYSESLNDHKRQWNRRHTRSTRFPTKPLTSRGHFYPQSGLWLPQKDRCSSGTLHRSLGSQEKQEQMLQTTTCSQTKSFSQRNCSRSKNYRFRRRIVMLLSPVSLTGLSSAFVYPS